MDDDTEVSARVNGKLRDKLIREVNNVQRRRDTARYGKIGVTLRRLSRNPLCPEILIPRTFGNSRMTDEC